MCVCVGGGGGAWMCVCVDVCMCVSVSGNPATIHNLYYVSSTCTYHGYKLRVHGLQEILSQLPFA